jgi:ankyrin repeat protein
VYLGVQAVLGYEDCAEALVHEGADIRQPDCLGRTAVHLAALCGHASILVHLAQVFDRHNRTLLILFGVALEL